MDFDHMEALPGPDPTQTPLQGPEWQAAQEAEKQAARAALQTLIESAKGAHDALLGNMAARGVRGELAMIIHRLKASQTAL